jgi:hypothetical protein
MEIEQKKYLKIIVGCLITSVLLFLFLYDTKVRDDYYDFGFLMAILLLCVDLVLFLFGIIGVVLMSREWFRNRKS